ncbi:uncharacterized protein SCDLUD_001184 [Saccharomycodes ludwigii]|uniref:uncharacterized protein n=1 Tax=Saccharomycodes ludwigii TaxID=36035 RepID=UPI001E86CABE|nr:hypothetical protein SCDLUD_001184 [Saccharomycodes ludwigii]KAH3903542.1 hypothetical protein SCDLUD_001184 [Saccharomycodes ludwigii]
MNTINYSTTNSDDLIYPMSFNYNNDAAADFYIPDSSFNYGNSGTVSLNQEEDDQDFNFEFESDNNNNYTVATTEISPSSSLSSSYSCLSYNKCNDNEFLIPMYINEMDRNDIHASHTPCVTNDAYNSTSEKVTIPDIPESIKGETCASDNYKLWLMNSY